MDAVSENEAEETISIREYLKDVEEQELEADLVLGGDEGKECTFWKGSVLYMWSLPYPDPDLEDQVDMIQCCLCEDWFHEEHIGLDPSDEIPRDEEGEPLYDEFICQACSAVCSFLNFYPPVILSNKEQCDPTPSKNKEVEEMTLIKRMDEKEGLADNIHKKDDIATRSDSSQCIQKGNDIVSQTTCVIGTNTLDNPPVKESKPIFLSKNWRDALCGCEKCVNMYNEKGISFLLDKEDTIMEYEKVAKEKREEKLQQQEGVELNLLNSMDHVQKDGNLEWNCRHER
ncbi:hypothetical protein SAY87_014511 [Trapa incisa]|uniref:Uncharacterized protein n=1 Tax=Trapa incisa TaxID=236973 RepID=A0AAN7JL82_9MYRT|nr:hypothetical protein SAY87_014511 [Trapa incisa]